MIIIRVIGRTDLSGKELHSQVGMDGYSGDIREPTLSTLAWNVRDVDSIPTLGTIFPIFIATGHDNWLP